MMPLVAVCFVLSVRPPDVSTRRANVANGRAESWREQASLITTRRQSNAPAVYVTFDIARAVHVIASCRAACARPIDYFTLAGTSDNYHAFLSTSFAFLSTLFAGYFSSN